MTTIPCKPGASGPFVMIFEDLAGTVIGMLLTAIGATGVSRRSTPRHREDR